MVNIVILTMLGLLIIGLGYNIFSQKGIRSRGKPRPAPTPVTGGRKRGPTKLSASTSPVLAPPDLSRITSSPEEREFYLSKQISPENLNQMLDHAAEISKKINARSRFLEALSDANYDPKKVSELVLSDPALTGEILKTVNSPLYNLQQQVASVFRAIVLLGHVEVRNIIWRSCMSDSKPIKDTEQNMFLDQLWQHSFDASRIAFAIARDRQLPEPDRIATTALLHDIGKLICFYIWPDRAMSLYNPLRFSNADSLAAESRINTWHAAAGSELARSWGLPEVTCTSILFSHAPSYLEPEYVDGDPREITVIYLANLICHNATALASSDATGKLYHPQPGWLQSLGLFTLEEVFTPSVLKAMPKPHPEIVPDAGSGEDAEPTSDLRDIPEKIGLLDSDDIAGIEGESAAVEASDPEVKGEPAPPAKMTGEEPELVPSGSVDRED